MMAHTAVSTQAARKIMTPRLSSPQIRVLLQSGFMHDSDGASCLNSLFTHELASTIPKIDQMGKKDAYRYLLSTPLGPLPTTSNASFKWWLFVCNLGKNTREVMGPGIMAAALEEKTETYAQVLLTRSDNT